MTILDLHPPGSLLDALLLEAAIVALDVARAFLAARPSRGGDGYLSHAAASAAWVRGGGYLARASLPAPQGFLTLAARSQS